MWLSNLVEGLVELWLVFVALCLFLGAVHFVGEFVVQAVIQKSWNPILECFQRIIGFFMPHILSLAFLWGSFWLFIYLQSSCGDSWNGEEHWEEAR